jgi:hypothetical protein
VYVGQIVRRVTPLSLWERDLQSPGLNAIYVISLIGTSSDENEVLLHMGDPAFIDPEERALWSPKTKESRQAAWTRKVKRVGIVASHQLMVRIVKARDRVVAQLYQSHGAAYSMGDWMTGKVPRPDECKEWLKPLESVEAVARLGTLLEMLADAKIDDTARTLQYTRLTGVPLGRPLEQMRLVFWRINLHA